MYNAFKVFAVMSLLLHLVLLLVTITDYFNRIFIGIALLVLIMPRKWWGLYILPVLLLFIGFVVGGYLLSMKFIA